MKINSWKEFTELIESSIPNYPDTTTNYIQFRGQSNSEWKLEPSLLRLVKQKEISVKKAHFYEKQAQAEFLSQLHVTEGKIAYHESINPISIYVDMQHFSCPTRLLDWSESAFIAMYFAINENFGQDGALWMWDSREYDKKMLATHSNFLNVNVDAIFNYKEYDLVKIIFSTRKNERLIKQRGSFTISNNLLKNHCDMITEINKKNPNTSGLFKIEIPKELKLEFLARLRDMNISASSLFPGLDGLGRSIKETLILRQFSENKQHFA